MLTVAGYKLTSCECLIPAITCRADEDVEHRRFNSALTTVLMEEFKQLMGVQSSSQTCRATDSTKFEKADCWSKAGGNDTQLGRATVPQMDSVADPTFSMPNSGSSPRAYMVGHLAKQISTQAGKDIQRSFGKNTGQPFRHGMLPIRRL